MTAAKRNRGEAQVFQSKSFSNKSFSPRSWWRGVVTTRRTIHNVIRVTVLTKASRTVTRQGRRCILTIENRLLIV